ncbi:MAG: hypothetical protein O2826_02685 [Chloroflexi bacterium]|nr:hypothetical protein [Chloroflexota bacterium]MDA1173406.1 hypothetical protein [Chloroflexota bacterium]
MKFVVSRVPRFPATLLIVSLVAVALLIWPKPASGYTISVGLDGAATDFAVGNDVPFSAVITFQSLDEVLEPVVTAGLEGPTDSGFVRVMNNIPIGVGESVAFGPIASATPNDDTFLAGVATQVSIFNGFVGTGYGYGYKALVAGATITISGTISLPVSAPSGTHTLTFTVDNGTGPGSPASAELTFDVVDSLAHTLPVGW